MNAEIIRLEDARTLKKLGLPLNTHIEERFFSPAYTEHWFELIKAHRKFIAAIYKLNDDPEAVTIGKWNLVRRRLSELVEAVHSADRFIDGLGGNVDPPVFKCGQDEDEYHILASFLAQEAFPFIEFWEEAITLVVEEGVSLTLNLDDLTLWAA